VVETGKASAGEWVLLSYRLPREPSTPRIATWRRLKRLGVAQLSDGLVGLPADARTREQLEWIADEIQEVGGTAGLWLARPATAIQERDLATAMARDRAAEYVELTQEARAATGMADAERTRAAKRLREKWRQVTRRDFFPPRERDMAQSAVRALVGPSSPKERADSGVAP